MLEVESSLLGQDWTMTDIDEMDIFRYFRVVAYSSKKTDSGSREKRGFIEDVM